jgi:uncharacterized delta-60 repeat protein
MLRLLPILLIGTFALSAGVAHGAPADTDRGFGSNGRAVIDLGGNDDVYAAAVQPDGKILLAGYTSLKYDAAIARLNPDGSPDRGFGADGVARPEGAGSEWIRDIAVQPDGKIVVGGRTSEGSNGFVRRLNSDGSPDKGFGTDGVAVIDSGGSEELYGLAIQPDGAIVAAGTTTVDKNMAVYRLTAGGKPDNSFDGDGARGIDVLGEDWAYDVALQADGKIVVFGASRVGTGSPYPAIARLDGQGKPDTTLGSAGWRTADERGYFYAGAVQPDGRIVAAGDTWVEDDASIYRFTSAGLPDKSFSENGWIGFDFGDDEEAHALALQPDGKIVIAGNTEAGDDAAVWRVNADGSRDRGFGEDGGLAVPGAGLEDAVGLAIQPDGKLVLAGTKVGFDGDALAYRLLGDSRAAQPGGSGGQGGPAGARCEGRRATIVGTARRDVLRGTRGRDVIAALGGNDVVRGLGGADVICAGAGNDVVAGGAGNDRVWGNGGRDRLLGGAGRDRLVGGPGRDRLVGGPGRDRVR